VLRLAQEGASIITIDSCADIGSSPYAMATEQDLAETVRLVEATVLAIFARLGDVRDVDQLRDVVREGVAEFGCLDIVSANAGLLSLERIVDLSEAQWPDVIDVNLTGA
jgi:(+)-trans-carveol dehydrogenase